MSMADLRLARLLSLMTLLRSRRGHTAASLARELECCERTVYRDLKVLRLAGMPVEIDSESGGYRCDGDFFLPPLHLTFAEALALSGIEFGRDGSRNSVLFHDGHRALAKVRGQLPQSVRTELGTLDGHVQIHGPRVSPQPGCEEHFDRVRKAIATKRKLRCRYHDGHNEPTGPFLFRPYALFFGQRAWYVVGHSELRDGERCLKLSRFQSLDLTDRPFMIPPKWSLDRSLGLAWRMIRGDRRYKIHVQFDAEFARNVADTLWHPTQTIHWQPDGSCIFECEVDGLDEITWWILSYGPHAKVLRPQALITQIANLADQTNQLYQQATAKPLPESA